MKGSKTRVWLPFSSTDFPFLIYHFSFAIEEKTFFSAIERLCRLPCGKGCAFPHRFVIDEASPPWEA
jgi:hypothetical protein